VCWSIVVKEKPTIGSPFFGAFPSDRIPKVTTQIMRYNFPLNIKTCKLHQPITRTFKVNKYMLNFDKLITFVFVRNVLPRNLSSAHYVNDYFQAHEGNNFKITSMRIMLHEILMVYFSHLDDGDTLTGTCKEIFSALYTTRVKVL
jgi:hypothetical protein